MNQPDRSLPLAIARRTYGEEIEQRVRLAIDELILQGKRPSFYSVAETACVARSTLYRKPELKVLVMDARAVRSKPSAHPARELDDLRQENALLLAELEQVCEKHNRLAEQLAKPTRNASSYTHYYICALDDVA